MAVAILPIDSSQRHAAYFAAVTALPFTKILDKPVHRVDMWNVASTGEHVPDELFGTMCAEKTIELLQSRRDVLLLQNIIATMVSKGRLTAIEVAFIEIICQRFTEIV